MNKELRANGFLVFGLMTCIVGAYFLYTGVIFSIDNRPAPAHAYKTMITWMIIPVQQGGQDYTPLIPKILEAMVDDVVLKREWDEIQEAREEIDIEHFRIMLRRVIN